MDILLYTFISKYCLYYPNPRCNEINFLKTRMLLYFTVANKAQYQPLSVSIGNTSGDLSIIFNGTGNDGTGRYWLHLAPPRLFNTLHIEHTNVAQNVLTLCEILVYDTGLSNI